MSFWDFVWILIIFVPLTLLWCFGLMDVFRRDDMNGVSKVLWIIVFFVVPWFGVLIYMVTRRPGGTPEERKALDEANRPSPVPPSVPSSSSTAEELAKLAGLRDTGVLTDAEFEAQKAKLLAAP